jgi:hypothetical protein
MRLCSDVIPDVAKVTACMKRKSSQVSPARDATAHRREHYHHHYRHAIIAADLAGECVMARGVNWSRKTTSDRMRRQGIEDINSKMPVVGQPAKQLSKADLREQAAAEFLAWRVG